MALESAEPPPFEPLLTITDKDAPGVLVALDEPVLLRMNQFYLLTRIARAIREEWLTGPDLDVQWAKLIDDSAPDWKHGKAGFFQDEFTEAERFHEAALRLSWIRSHPSYLSAMDKGAEIKSQQEAALEKAMRDSLKAWGETAK